MPAASASSIAHSVRLAWAAIAVCIVAAALVVWPGRASADSIAGPDFKVTGTIVAKHQGVITVEVSAVDPMAGGIAAPAAGAPISVRVGSGSRFLEVGRAYTMYVFVDRSDGALTTGIPNMVNADGTRIDAGLLRRLEVQIALAVAAIATIAAVVYRIVRYRHPRKNLWEL